MQFKKIAIFGRKNNVEVAQIIMKVATFLEKKSIKIYLDDQTALHYKDINMNIPIFSRDFIGKNCDLGIVVGGDGSILDVARLMSYYHKPILGINKGKLGFLADINFDNYELILTDILQKKYVQHELFLLDIKLFRDKKVIYNDVAVNDVVLNVGDITHMIEFDTYINNKFMYRQRSDGLIIATPTGSTAYSLSGGGPILHPTLNSIALVPMFPHNLSSRAVVIHGDDEIKIKIQESEDKKMPGISCDGMDKQNIGLNETIVIKKAVNKLYMLHPVNYNYFEILRTKLHWNKV